MSDEPVDPGSGRPLRQYQMIRCSRCPHGGTLHEKNGRCLVPDCECPGFEPDPVLAPEVILTGGHRPERLPDTELTERERFQTEHRYQEVTPANMGAVAEADAGDRGATSAIEGTNPSRPLLEKSDVLRNSHEGAHYHDFAIEPIQYIEANQIPFHEANIIKYVSRWRLKDGLDDLKKARFYLDRLIEISSE